MRIRLALALAAVALLQGCADYRYRSAQGLEWYQSNEARKQELTKQGFDQYSPNM